MMRDHLAALERRLEEVEELLADPAVATDAVRVTELSREHGRLAETVAAARRLRELDEDLDSARELLGEAADDDARMLSAEVGNLEREREVLESQIVRRLLPLDPADDRHVIVEIRAAAGGDEAALFAGELLGMYLRYAEARGWRPRTLSASHQEMGGVKEAIVEIQGEGAYGRLKHESGVHRVQRVPTTESQGRIHTSTASVAVLPVAEEVDIDLDESDLRIDVFRASGPGGQSVNTTDSAVRVTHLPSGIVVSCQDEKSQHQNRDKAIRILRARLLQLEQERVAQERADARRGQIGTGDRSEKIRTYNFPQSRVTDHRIGYTAHNLAEMLSGELDGVLDALALAEQEALLASLGDEEQAS